MPATCVSAIPSAGLDAKLSRQTSRGTAARGGSLTEMAVRLDSPPRHAATFYGSEASLVSTVTTFLNDGLIAGEPALVIATPGHRLAFETALQAGLIDVVRAKRTGNLVMLDAEDMMGTFTVNGLPDQNAFERTFGSIMRQIQRGRARAPIRAYGEIVNVLWQQGATDAAIQVEMLWNKLATSVEFSLLCGYAMGNFRKQAAGLQDVCRLHTHVSHIATGGTRSAAY